MWAHGGSQLGEQVASYTIITNSNSLILYSWILEISYDNLEIQAYKHREIIITSSKV